MLSCRLCQERISSYLLCSEKGSTRDDDTFCRLSKFQINVIGLSATDIIWAFTGKDEIRTELTVSALPDRLCVRSIQNPTPDVRMLRTIPFSRGRYNVHRSKLRSYSPTNRLFVRSSVRPKHLAQHDIQQSQFTVDLRADIQMFLAFMNQSNIFTHIRQTSFHFVHLDRTEIES